MQTICTSLQTDNHDTPSLNFYRPDALPDSQPTVSKHWRMVKVAKEKPGVDSRHKILQKNDRSVICREDDADAFSALTLLVGQQEGHPACKKTEWWGAGMVIPLERGADLHMAKCYCIFTLRTTKTEHYNMHMP